MPPTKYHSKPFDEGTLTKLQLLECYLGEWLPVFLASPRPSKPEIHIFDFFAGPGKDTEGELGSPLRVLRQLSKFRNLPGWSKVRVNAHFFDSEIAMTSALKENIREAALGPPGIHVDTQTLEFDEALQMYAPTLSNPWAAKFVFIDQFGVDQVTADVFRRLVQFPTCDFLFFLSSSTLYRFRDHPAIEPKITRPDDYYHLHRAVLAYYRSLLPSPTTFYLAPFSIKKGANIYGVIFGSAHVLGLDKFLQVAWKRDEINGEANFDINRENLLPNQHALPLPDFRPTKVTAFELDLEGQLREGRLSTEADVIRLCFEHGVRRQHAAPILDELKKKHVIEAPFKVPSINRMGAPRPIRMLAL